MRLIHGKPVYGLDIDPETRCAHWHGGLDIIAIKFKCCGEWFPCFECHSAVAGHEAKVWPVEERNAEAILCGSCGRRLSISEYFDCGSDCPACKKPFNPGCANQYHLYDA